MTRQGAFDGLNVTMPLKQIAARSVDRMDNLALSAGSVNTVVVDNSTLVGYSSDALAFSQLWLEPTLAEFDAIHVLGSGGSARAATASLPKGVSLYVSARRPEAAGALADEYGGQVVRWGVAVAGSIVVNCTPLGMSGEGLPDAVLRAAGAVVDLPYGSDATPAVTLAQKLDKPVVNGLTFLVRQAVESFRLWTGVTVPIDEVLARLRIS